MTTTSFWADRQAVSVRDHTRYTDLEHPWVSDFLAGLTHSEIATKYQANARAVEAALRRRRAPNIQGLTADILFSKFKEGKTLPEITKELNVNRGVLDRWIKFHGFDGYSYHQAKAEAKSGKVLTKEIAEGLYLGLSWSSARIAREYGFAGDGFVRDRLRSWGIRIRRDGEHAFKHEDPEGLAEALWRHEEIAARYEAGESTYEIAESLGLGQREGPVRRALYRAGVKPEGWTKFASKRKKGKPHEALIARLDSSGVNHESCHILSLPFRDGRVRGLEFDECFPDQKILVEVNGVFFHGREERALKSPSVRRKLWTDALKTQAVYDHLPGWYLLHIWEDQVESFNPLDLSGHSGGPLDASPFGDYRSVLWARSQSLRVKLELTKEENNPRPIYTTLTE